MNDRNVYEGALRLRNEPSFADFREWIDAQREAALKVLTSSQDPMTMARAQGDYNAWQRLKVFIQTSPEALEKLARR